MLINSDAAQKNHSKFNFKTTLGQLEFTNAQQQFDVKGPLERLKFLVLD